MEYKKRRKSFKKYFRHEDGKNISETVKTGWLWNGGCDGEEGGNDGLDE
jgi:hypothetical protein